MHIPSVDTPSSQKYSPFPFLSRIIQQLNTNSWFLAARRILPIYISAHLIIFVGIACIGLFTRDEFDPIFPTLREIWEGWNRWDVGHYRHIVRFGYDEAYRTAFFPLYPVLGYLLKLIIQDPTLSLFLISNIAGFVACIVFYRLIQHDFDEELAERTVHYHTIYPTALFLVAAYNESLFISLILLSFYSMRRGKWWLAGLFGLFASLTRSAGILLVVPFAFEYLRQHQFHIKNIRWNVLGIGLIPVGLCIFAFYCYLTFGDFLAFSNAQKEWQRGFSMPWTGQLGALETLFSSKHIFTPMALRTLFDLIPSLAIPVLIILMVVGPWRFQREQTVYIIFAAVLYLFIHSVSVDSDFPLMSFARYSLEIFPAFIMLARIFSSKSSSRLYVGISTAMLTIFVVQYMQGHWIV